MHNTSQTLTFVLIMTTIVALLLAVLQNGLKSKHDFNEALYSKKATLAAVADQLDMDFTKITNDQVTQIFEKQIKQSVVNDKGEVIPKEELVKDGVKNGLPENLDLAKEDKVPVDDRLMPIYEFTKSDGDKYYIVYARGKGLWDAIWGNIALESDLNTIAGVSFDHKAETPGLGAEIKDNKAWVKQWIGKKLYGPEGKFVGVKVRKGGAKDPVYEVDAISGATITGDGVEEMIDTDVVAYDAYFDKLRK
ncbi:NADH:ubiquinone reductase (Na(+)-transporting) subunit C [Saprospiraceae bacterium]|nr:NADH:ubiquinone reductase (Na(+)-transporting) subunit C [Saprospiraceae bacterium]